MTLVGPLALSELYWVFHLASFCRLCFHKCCGYIPEDHQILHRSIIPSLVYPDLLKEIQLYHRSLHQSRSACCPVPTSDTHHAAQQPWGRICSWWTHTDLNWTEDLFCNGVNISIEDGSNLRSHGNSPIGAGLAHWLPLAFVDSCTQACLDLRAW